ncbi:cyclic-di-GMP phosphodiesterase [compost metagenome]
MRVVGVGVDNAESLAALRDLGCEIAQGFFIARPMRADLLLEWARAYSSANAGRGPDLIAEAVSAEA